MKERWQQAAASFRSLPPGVKAAIECLTPDKLVSDDLADIEGDWIVAEVQMAKILPADRDQPLSKAHEMIRKLLCHVAAQNLR